MTGELQQLNDAREVSQVDEGDIGDSISMNDIPFGPYPSPLFYDEENNSSCTSSMIQAHQERHCVQCGLFSDMLV